MVFKAMRRLLVFLLLLGLSSLIENASAFLFFLFWCIDAVADALTRGYVIILDAVQREGGGYFIELELVMNFVYRKDKFKR